MKDYSMYNTYKITYHYSLGERSIYLLALTTREAVLKGLYHFNLLGYTAKPCTIICKRI